jgi:hypothetical protein
MGLPVILFYTQIHEQHRSVFTIIALNNVTTSKIWTTHCFHRPEHRRLLQFYLKSIECCTQLDTELSVSNQRPIPFNSTNERKDERIPSLSNPHPSIVSTHSTSLSMCQAVSPSSARPNKGGEYDIILTDGWFLGYNFKHTCETLGRGSARHILTQTTCTTRS